MLVSVKETERVAMHNSGIRGKVARDMKLVLKDRRLSFVNTGAKLLHLKSTGGTPENAELNISTRTIGACNITLPSGQFVFEREMDESKVCGHCLNTARRFNIMRSPEVWVAEEIDS